MSPNLSRYFKRMIPSFIMMLLITYGIKEQNPWLQYGSIGLLFAGTIVYQGIKAARSRHEVDANHDEARKVMKQKLIVEVMRDEVTKAKRSGKSIGGLSPTTSLVFILPLVIFIGTGYLLSNLVPDIEPWQSYLVGFLITMPVSTILSIKTGLGSMTPTAAPNSYYISNKGIVFEQMNQYYILHYPIVALEVKEESNCVEVEGQPTKAPLIPNRIRLFSKDAKKLQRLLTQFEA